MHVNTFNRCLIYLCILQDFLNHLISDLEDFMKRLYEISAAKKELERIRKSGKRRNECEHMLVNNKLIVSHSHNYIKAI